ncbi:MAG: TrmB family transcriptional regulator [Candidatus Helarchaeota archaeon]
MNRDDIIKELKNFNILENDAKIYLYLVENGQQKLSTIAQECGVPRSQAYEALTRLINQGFVYKELVSKQPKYSSIPPDVFIGRLEYKTKKLANKVDELREKFKEIMLKEKRERKIFFIDNPEECKTNFEIFLKNATKSIKGFFVIEDSANSFFFKSIFPEKILLEKSKSIKDIKFVLNKDGIHQSTLKNLIKNGIQIIYWKGIKNIPLNVLIIDKRYLLIFSYRAEPFNFSFIDLVIFENMFEYLNVFDYLLKFFEITNTSTKNEK